MESDWPFVKLKDICTHSAFGPRFSSDEYAIDGNVACLRTMDIDSNGGIDFEAMPRAKLDLTRLSSHVLQRGDIVMTRTGAYLGKVAVFSEFRLPVLPGAFSIRFRLDREIALPLFIRYYFNGEDGQRSIQTVATGSAQPNINITNLHTLEVPLPPLQTQEAIAGVLGTLDDKIELNRLMNGTLEAMARALFKSWFVDFDPVIDNALAAGNPIPEPLQARAETRRALGPHCKPLPAHIQKLFPDAFAVDADLRETNADPSGGNVMLTGRFSGLTPRANNADSSGVKTSRNRPGNDSRGFRPELPTWTPPESCMRKRPENSLQLDVFLTTINPS